MRLENVYFREWSLFAGEMWSLGRKGLSLIFVDRGLYSEGKYRVISLGGTLSDLCSQGVLVRRSSLGQV